MPRDYALQDPASSAYDADTAALDLRPTNSLTPAVTLPDALAGRHGVQRAFICKRSLIDISIITSRRCD